MTLWNIVCSVLGVNYVEMQLQNSNLTNHFYAKDVDVVLLTYGVRVYDVFLNPFVTTELDLSESLNKMFQQIISIKAMQCFIKLVNFMFLLRTFWMV